MRILDVLVIGMTGQRCRIATIIIVIARRRRLVMVDVAGAKVSAMNATAARYRVMATQ